MKILVLSDDFPPASPGGAGTVAIELTKAYKKAGHEVLVVTTVREEKDAGEVVHEGLSIIRIATSYSLLWQAYISLNNRPVVRKVREILASFKPDAVHAHNVHAYLSYASLRAAKESGARVILTCHDVMTFSHGKFTEFIDRKNHDVPSRFNYRLKPFEQLFSYRLRYNLFRNVAIKKILNKYVDHVVAVSAELKKAMNENGVRCDEVIHNAIDVNEWQVEGEKVKEFKEKFRLGDSVILFGGRLSGIKGGSELILAVKQIKTKVPDVQILVIGEKNKYAMRMQELLGEYIGKEEAARSLVFTGWLSGEDLHTAYHAATVAATPSLCFDTFIMVNLEAMAVKKPAVTTCFGGAKEVVEDGVTGYVVNPYDVSMLALKLLDLLYNKQKAEKFGEAGYRRASSVFSMEKSRTKYETFFKV